MQEYSVPHAVCAAVTSPDNVMVVPSRRLRDLLVAHWAESLLLLPEAEELPASLEIIFHLCVYSTLEVSLPLRVIWIRFASHLDVPFDRHTFDIEQPHEPGRPARVGVLALKDPVPVAELIEVFSFDPPLRPPQVNLPRFSGHEVYAA
jgi:hypothetical protein